jgi:hypothetical protein
VIGSAIGSRPYTSVGSGAHHDVDVEDACKVHYRHEQDGENKCGEGELDEGLAGLAPGMAGTIGGRSTEWHIATNSDYINSHYLSPISKTPSIASL